MCEPAVNSSSSIFMSSTHLYPHHHHHHDNEPVMDMASEHSPMPMAALAEPSELHKSFQSAAAISHMQSDVVHSDRVKKNGGDDASYSESEA